MDSATTTAAAGEKSILFQAMGPIGDAAVMKNTWLIIQPTPQEGIFETFCDILPPEDRALVGISSAFVRSCLYTVGGRMPNTDYLSSCISYLDMGNLSEGWKVSTLRSTLFASVLGVYDDSLYILPGPWKFGYYGNEDTYNTEQKGYIWNTRDKKLHETEILPPMVDGVKRQWRRIRACAALDGRGLLIAMDGEESNFFLYNPKENDWEICKFKDPLPEFIDDTSFAASNGRLYILEVRDWSPLLYIYNIKEGKLVMTRVPILEFDDLWTVEKEDRVVRLVPMADDELCFLWLGPPYYNEGNVWPPIRTLHYVKFKVSISPNPAVVVVDNKVSRTNITKLLDCLLCDALQKQLEDNASAGAIGKRLIYDLQEKRKRIPDDRNRRQKMPKKRDKEYWKSMRKIKSSKDEEIELLKNEIEALKRELDAKTREENERQNRLDELQILHRRECEKNEGLLSKLHNMYERCIGLLERQNYGSLQHGTTSLIDSTIEDPNPGGSV